MAVFESNTMKGITSPDNCDCENIHINNIAKTDTPLFR